ncbi:MAG: hypothetical protein K8W52_20220 [Deltaproteobacteria bacterium]|nr:hypothetical protein [Deltaproteobacteria bacterium]
MGRARIAIWVAVCGVGVAACKCHVDPPQSWDAAAVTTTIDAGGQHTLGAAPRSLGLSADDAREFYALSEGSELFPLSWAMNMDSAATGAPFMAHLERFGLITPDAPKDPLNLPIGITINTPDDLNTIGGVKMLGVNCAACHVGELEVGGHRLRIDGAPNQFDIQKFYVELGDSAAATLKSGNLKKLLKMLFGGIGGGVDFDSFRRPGVDPALANALELVQDQLGEIDVLHAGGGAGDRLADEVEAIVKKASDQFDSEYAHAAVKEQFLETLLLANEPPRSRLPGAPPKFGSIDLGVLEHAAGDHLGQLGDLLDQRAALLAWIDELPRRVRLLKARIAFLRAVAGRNKELSVPDTAPLYGRVDAFGFARNFLFGATYGYQPNTAPISYPHLWGMKRAAWLHWNANTNSVMSRNIGQALGVGAVVNLGAHDTYVSSVMVENLHKLEGYAASLAPPRWGEVAPAVLPPIDPALAAQGQPIYARDCASCHDAVTKIGELEDYPMVELAKVGTDPNQATNFALPLAPDVRFDAALDQLLQKIEAKYAATHHIGPATVTAWHGGREPIAWRSPLAYPARPLAGVWATAPYLHNNAVPTLDQLLRAPAARPAKFVVGNRTYDPVEVGYAWRPTGAADEAARTFDTSQPGNGNGGHDYFHGTDDERRALLEYLKTL